LCRASARIAYINASVVQGSGFGPSSFDIVASDLHPLLVQRMQVCILAKYADDTYLIIPHQREQPFEMN